jgi:geranylgeranyl pyrophosphate synthase
VPDRAATGSLSTFLAETRARVDEALETLLPKPPACPQILSDAMRYSVFAGGKRFRPALTLAAAGAVGRSRGITDDEHLGNVMLAAMPAACAIEMIHTYSLIHDDLPAMDDDKLRRGRPTLHVVYGDGIAILAGDGLHAEAFSVLAGDFDPQEDTPEVAARKMRVMQLIGLAAGPAGMVGGQAIDLQAAGQAPGPRAALDAERLRAMHAMKTGALIRAAAVCGAIMGGGSDRAIGAIGCYASELGLAFQIVDDILDVEGEASALGKTAGKDAAADKPTYPSLFGLEQSRQLAADAIARGGAALRDAGVAPGWLDAIADWVVTRKA